MGGMRGDKERIARTFRATLTRPPRTKNERRESEGGNKKRKEIQKERDWAERGNWGRRRVEGVEEKRTDVNSERQHWCVLVRARSSPKSQGAKCNSWSVRYVLVHYALVRSPYELTVRSLINAFDRSPRQGDSLIPNRSNHKYC